MTVMKKLRFPAGAAVPAILAAAVFSAAVNTGAAVQEAALRKALTFHASFDGKVDAAYAAAIQGCIGPRP